MESRLFRDIDIIDRDSETRTDVKHDVRKRPTDLPRTQQITSPPIVDRGRKLSGPLASFPVYYVA